jgi:hypothetical protein
MPVLPGSDDRILHMGLPNMENIEQWEGSSLGRDCEPLTELDWYQLDHSEEWHLGGMWLL